VVQTDGGLRLTGSVTDPTAHPVADTPVTVAIRPEHLEVSAAGSADSHAGDANGNAGWTVIRGRIHQGTYLGDQTEYRVATDQAGELIVRRQNQLRADATHGLGPGDPVSVSWHEAANLVLVG
jgi:ABC-type Fe3+/spermidine/putrescine transport system ATPase subunit